MEQLLVSLGMVVRYWELYKQSGAEEWKGPLCFDYQRTVPNLT